MGTAFAELRSLAGGTGYRLPLPPRRDRRNALVLVTRNAGPQPSKPKKLRMRPRIC
jgi:hypothetical protein